MNGVTWSGDAEPLGDRSAVALVTVDELDDSGRLAERADPLVEARAVDDVRQPDASSDPERMRRALEALSLEMPAEPVLELVTETELHGNTIRRGSAERHLEPGAARGRPQATHRFSPYPGKTAHVCAAGVAKSELLAAGPGPAAGHPPVLA